MRSTYLVFQEGRSSASFYMMLNPNLDFAHRFVHSLAHSGLRAVCIAPGSRSTPLTLAFHEHPGIELFLHLDERAASFFALGHALATERPVALVCTSGTATAEFHAAAVEARQAGVPLLLLTADRPPELRHSGANQTVDQVKMYGDHVLWAVDVALPTADAPDVARREMSTLAARAYATANGAGPSAERGPVHLNFSFRKPLEPASAQALGDFVGNAGNEVPTVIFSRGIQHPTDDQVDALTKLVATHERGLIICGPNCPTGDFAQAVYDLARVSGYPLLVDALSGVRFGPHVRSGGARPPTADEASLLSGGYETFLRHPPSWEAPDLILRFGAVPTSKWLGDYLRDTSPRHHLHIRSSGVWADDGHLVNHFLRADETTVCQQLAERLPLRDTSPWAEAVLRAESTARALTENYLTDHWFDGAAVAAAVEALPDGANLVIGNSLPVRHLDQFAFPSPRAIRTFGNRGASGIDGTTSTALGVAAANRRAPTLFLTGDVAFFHDLTGLLAIRQHALGNVTIVLLNNDGGSIFRRLPVAEFEPPFTELFRTPHGLDFAHAARLFEIDHLRADDRASFTQALATSLDGNGTRLIEVRTDGAQDLQQQRALVQRVREALSDR